MKLWGGRFEGETNAAIAAFTHSLPFDQRMLAQDIRGSIAHCRMLGRTGILVWDARTWKHTTFADAGEHAQPELGWALAREHWGQGYATEAASAVREWAYFERGVGRLISLIAPANVRSERLAERLGCTRGETVDLCDTGPAVVWEHP